MQLSLEWLFHPGSCTSGAPRRTWQVNRRMPRSCRAGRQAGSGWAGQESQAGGQASRRDGWLAGWVGKWAGLLGRARGQAGWHRQGFRSCTPATRARPTALLTASTRPHLGPRRRLLVLWNDDDGGLADGGLWVLVGGGLQAPRHLQQAGRRAGTQAACELSVRWQWCC